MYPRNTIRLELETKGSYSKAVIGILLLTMMGALGLSILGVWDYYDNTNGILTDPFLPDNNPSESKIFEDSTSEIKNSDGVVSETIASDTTIADTADTSSEETILGLGDVSVADSGFFGPFDTEPGAIEVVHANLPEGPLPLCITQEYVDPFYMVVASKGGYEPVGGLIMVFQDKNCFQGAIGIVWEEVDCHVEDGPYADCCWTFWKATLVVCEPICLESNVAPEVCPPWCVYPDDIDLMKDVWLCIKTMWTGCPLPDQHFLIILAHKVMSQKNIPNSR
jgi:hypothetical protein